MGFPDPQESTAIDIYQREFPDAERRQIKLDLFMLDNKESFGIKSVAIASRRLAKTVLKMHEKGILQLSDDERERLNIDDKDIIFVKKEIRDDIQNILTSSQAYEEANSQTEANVLLFRRPNEK